MTVRGLVILTAVALCCLGATAALWWSRGPSWNQTATAVEISGPAVATMTPVPVVTPVPPTPTQVPEPTPTVVVEPPALVTIPVDLIATPTPDSPTVVPLPVLTNIPSVPRDSSFVYLTFDDGPDPQYTNQVLDVLASYDAKATFFVIGNSVDAYPGVVQRIVNEGHTVGNHTYYHEALPRQDAAHVEQTLGATNAALSRAAGITSNCIRPPYGSMDQVTFDVVKAAGFTVQMWDVDSEDWKLNDSYAIASRVLADTELGDRVLFHDGPSKRASTVAALDSVLEVLSNRGVRFQALDC